MANFKVIAARGLKIRSGPGISYEEVTLPEDRLRHGEVVIEAVSAPHDNPAWLPILMEDETVGYVASQYVVAASGDYQTIEAAEIAPAQTPGLPIFQKQLTSLYGYPKERAGYLTTIDLREFATHLGHVRDFTGKPWSGKIYGHELLTTPVRRAFAILCNRGLTWELQTYDGCFNIRPITGGSSYSVHSWGLAVDFNAAQNPYGGPVRFSNEFIQCFAEAGFESGALWNTPDGMHFQLPWTRDWRQSDEELRPQL